MRKIIREIAALEVCYKIYLVASIPLLLATGLTFFRPSGNTVQAFLFLLAWIGFGCGFLVPSAAAGFSPLKSFVLQAWA